MIDNKYYYYYVVGIIRHSNLIFKQIKKFNIKEFYSLVEYSKCFAIIYPYYSCIYVYIASNKLNNFGY